MRTPAKLLVVICIVETPIPSSASDLKQPAWTTSLEGEWVSDCAPVGKNGRGHIVRVAFRKDRIEGSGQLYATTRCDVPSLRGGYWGKISRVRKRKDRLEMDYSFGDATFTLQRTDVVNHYNKVGGCGLAQWQLEVARSVAGQRCASLDLPQPGQKLYESLWLKGDELRMGAFPHDTSNRSEQARPTTPRPLVFRRVRKTAQ